jgi:hypothetical protein
LKPDTTTTDLAALNRVQKLLRTNRPTGEIVDFIRHQFAVSFAEAIALVAAGWLLLEAGLDVAEVEVVRPYLRHAG